MHPNVIWSYFNLYGGWPMLKTFLRMISNEEKIGLDLIKNS